jgi:hypothetical protein
MVVVPRADSFHQVSRVRSTCNASRTSGTALTDNKRAVPKAIARRSDRRGSMTRDVDVLPERLVPTHDAWHQVAEHVLAAAQYAETERIDLRVVDGGFRTAAMLRGNRTISVIGTRLVVTDDAGERSSPLTTVADAARLVGITAGLPGGVYPAATDLKPDAPLHVDAGSADVLAQWYGLADAALRHLAMEVGAEQEPILWPEHFDVGITAAAINYGGSPGDDHVRQPYLYVGPHAGPPLRDDFWNSDFGAARARDHIGSIDDALAFFREGRRRAAVSDR